MDTRQAITAAQMYQIEENGETKLGMKKFLMMENAGHGVSDFLVRRFGTKIAGKRIVSVCATGNNGGDGLVASRHLAGSGAQITILLLGSPEKIRSEEARMNWSIIARMDASISKIVVDGNSLGNEAIQQIKKANIIIDAIFGTGIKGSIGQPYSAAIDAINSSKAFKLAVDVPSGYDPDTGKPHDKCVRANATVTFHRFKIGLKRANRYTGTVHLERIGIPPDAEQGVLD